MNVDVCTYNGIKYNRKKEKWRIKTEKNKGVKILNFLSKTAKIFKIWSQKYASFLMKLLFFVNFFFVLKNWILKLYFHLPSNFV